MFKSVLCLSFCMIVSACFGSNQEPVDEASPEPATWSGDAYPEGSYAAEIERFTQVCQDGSEQIVTVGGSEVHVDVVRENAAPLRLYTFTVTFVNTDGSRSYVFEKSGVRSDGHFHVWKDVPGDHGRLYVEMIGRFEISDDGATRLTGRLVKNALEYPVAGHICSDVREFGQP
ncbi:MAG: hypothetical protein QY323_01875 [Patescibacteria group bacterium]|nr:MAG: hypothetical protein QY323_01875 [Patescibacteria group bacterium]